MMLQQKTTVIDLNWLLSCDNILLLSGRRNTANAQPTDSIFANTRFYSKASIQNMCQSLQRKLSNQIFLLLRSISYNGICSTDLSREPERYRNLFKSLASKTLSLRLSWKSFQKQFSQRQRKKRLANISRLRSSSYQKSKAAICQRGLRYYIEKYSLCFGRNRDRFVFDFVSMGSASQSKKCGKAAYANGLKRLYTDIYTHYKRFCARDNRFPEYAFRTTGHIYYGQRLHRLCNIIQFFKEQLLLYYKSKKERSLLSKMFSSSGQEHRFTKRPDHKIDRPENFKTLPDTTEANQLSRRRTKPNFRVFDQQFSVGCIDDLPALQTSLADRTVLQMDKTAFANKVVLWNFDQCCQDSGLDSHQCLCACSDNKKGTEAGAFTTRNTPDYKYPTFRENTAKTSTYGKLL